MAISRGPGNGSVTAGESIGGVRPSPGAALLESDRDVVQSDAPACSVLAAPGDGRTPKTPPPPPLTGYRASSFPSHLGTIAAYPKTGIPQKKVRSEEHTSELQSL